MKKELPKVFANKITKKINNNKEIYNSNQTQKEQSEIKSDTQEKIKKEETNEQIKKDKQIGKKKLKELKEKIEKELPNEEIEKKINRIIKTKNYLYKIPVTIKLEKKELTTFIIGKNKNNIITIDNELIRINKIQDIKVQEKNE